uniref:Uncharacterized protein n=1 Tax=Lactuca sativa TaxID=4236 RepID=A0A9R1V3H6_LACSA|nr:hypothetical protein LSAT_V11C700353630 [Lactuca sativa]
MTIFLAIKAHYANFKQKPDTRGRMGFSSVQKYSDALRYLGYNIAFDVSNEYLKIYHEDYLCKPTARDIERLYLAHEDRHGFSGIIGSLNGMHIALEMSKCVAQSIYSR